jgi:hypothetical protein
MNEQYRDQDSLITAKMLADLPEPVQRYMAYSNVIGKPWTRSIRLKQIGRFRQGADRAWMPMSAEQFYWTKPPSFIWKAAFKVAGLPLIRARDEYKSGKAHMFAKLAGLITLFDVRGEELDQGSMLRYLSEMIWFPIAFLGDNISWQEIDEHSAEVTFHDSGRSVSGRMHFDREGRPTNFTTNRYREINGQFSLDPWSTPITDYGEREGLNLPIRGQAVWNLPIGDLPYVDLEITEVVYNSPA